MQPLSPANLAKHMNTLNDCKWQPYHIHDTLIILNCTFAENVALNITIN